MTQIRAASVLLSPDYASQSFGYRILNLDGTTYSAFTTTNVAEDADDVVCYRVVGGIAAPDEGGVIVWGTSGNDVIRGGIPPASPTAAGIAAAVWAAGSRTLTSFGSLVSDIWANATRSLTDKAGFSLSSAGAQAIWDALTSALTATGSIGKRIADNLDATVNSRLATSSYTAPDNAAIATIAANVLLVLADTGTDGVALSTATLRAIADTMLVRGSANVDNPGTPEADSLYHAIAVLLRSSTAVSPGNLVTLKTDGGVFNTRPLSTNSSAVPIDGIGP